MKKNIIYISSVTILLIISIGIFYSINQSKTINPIINNPNNTATYYSEAGLENISSTIKDAVENYLNQNKTESNSVRNSRLSLYFSGSSPVYNYETKNITSLVDKTTARVLSIKSSEAEGEYPSYLVDVSVTLYSGTKSEIKNQTYWVSMIKLSDGSQIPYDIGGA